MIIDKQWANAFAEEWCAAWNSGDLERIFSHYTDDFEMCSPFIVERMGEPSGILRGKTAIRAYWGPALKTADPPIRFELIAAYTGADRIAIHYRSVKRTLVVEVLTFNADLRATHGMAVYGAPA
jgi:ketosteroid isomerase-like protein